MKLIYCILALLAFEGCHMKKITTVTLQNNNAYPMAVVIKANNITQKIGPVAAGQLLKTEMEWSQIDKKDGHFIIELQDANGGIVQSYEHGYFENGELYSNIDMIVEGVEVKIKVYN
jgi:hypothetical protein